MIIDEVHFQVKAGDGGAGSNIVQRRIDSSVHGWGGDGGEGGSVFLRVSPHLYDLSKYRGSSRFRAQNGKPGLANNKTGKSGEDLILQVPCGVLVKTDDGELIADLDKEEATCKVAQGGKGGQGNYHREYTTESQPGQARQLFLDYRIPADIALIGMPNSGKTTLFNALSGKNYKVANYPFTTRWCVWAPIEYEFERFWLMDMPALSSHSHQDRGMGNAFLKHLHRVKIIIIAIDAADEKDAAVQLLKEQISLFDGDASEGKKFFYLRTKADTIKESNEPGWLAVSAKTGKNIEILKKKIIEELGR